MDRHTGGKLYTPSKADLRWAELAVFVVNDIDV